MGGIKFHALSACEMKNNCCFFERFFKLQKIGVFLSEILFFQFYGNIDVFALCKLCKMMS